MAQRTYWLKLLESAWSPKAIVWLAGAHGVGKTFLCQSIPEVEYFNCSLLQVRRQMEDPQKFLGKLKKKKVILDEIHRLPNPGEILRVAADFLPSLKIIVTAPAKLPAFSHLPETLPGRVAQVWLTPMTSQDLVDFGNQDLAHRFLRGGLPSFFLSPERSEVEFHEWMDSFWAKDIQELFRLERRDPFQRFMELLFMQSGDIFEATRFAAPCGVSRPTITKYLAALEATQAVQVLRPFSTQRPTEIISAPKTYAFDTGFLCYYRGWQQLREEDFEFLWKHWVLNEIGSHLQGLAVQYWQDKRGHEVDFVLVRREMGLMTLSAQWKVKYFAPRNLQAFRYHYPGGPNWIVCQDLTRGYTHSFGKLKVDFMNLEEMNRRLFAFRPLKEFRPYPLPERK